MLKTFYFITKTEKNSKVFNKKRSNFMEFVENSVEYVGKPHCYVAFFFVDKFNF